mgnify:CR=1 FL=1
MSRTSPDIYDVRESIGWSWDDRELIGSGRGLNLRTSHDYRTSFTMYLRCSWYAWVFVVFISSFAYQESMFAGANHREHWVREPTMIRCHDHRRNISRTFTMIVNVREMFLRWSPDHVPRSPRLTIIGRCSGPYDHTIISPVWTHCEYDNHSSNAFAISDLLTSDGQTDA